MLGTIFWNSPKLFAFIMQIVEFYGSEQFQEVLTAIKCVNKTWERQQAEPYVLHMVEVVLLIDMKSWNKQYENISDLFMPYPYVWDDSDSGKENNKMRINPVTNQPYYYLYKEVFTVPLSYERIPCSPQRIFCTSYDPEPENVGTLDEPIWVQDPQNAVQFFGTREECFRLNPDSEPTGVSEPMYLDQNGFVIYPDPETGKVNTILSPKVEGYAFLPLNFTPLHLPEQ